EVHIDEELYERIKKEYEEDAHFQKILKALEDPSCDEVKRLGKQLNHYKLCENGIIIFEDKENPWLCLTKKSKTRIDIAQPPTPVIREHHSDPEFKVEGILDKRIFHRQ
ncbi:1369_t:CDS:2, partial [Cetraspora pellucida]